MTDTINPYTITAAEFAKLGIFVRADIESTLRQEWRTPPELFMALDAEFHFDIDVAASRHNALCERFLDAECDGLKARWFDPAYGIRSAFCNPGFADGEAWIHRAHSETKDAPGSCAVVIGLASVASDWFAYAAQHATEIRLLTPRVQFLSPNPNIIKQTSNPRESAAFIFRNNGERIVGAAISLWRWKK